MGSNLTWVITPSMSPDGAFVALTLTSPMGQTAYLHLDYSEACSFAGELNKSILWCQNALRNPLRDD